MQNCVFNTTDILINWHPVTKRFFIKWLAIKFWRTESYKIPGRVYKGIQSVRFPYCWFTRFFVLSIFPSRMLIKRISFVV